MQITLKDSEALNGEATVRTAPIDISDIPLFTATLIIHSIGGTTPSVSVQFATSENMEDWDDVGAAIARTAMGIERSAFTASSDVWGRYVRATVTFTGTTPKVVYSLYMNTFPQS